MQDRNNQSNRSGQKNRTWGNSQAQPYRQSYGQQGGQQNYGQQNSRQQNNDQYGQAGNQPFGQYLGTDREQNSQSSSRLRQDAESAFGSTRNQQGGVDQDYSESTGYGSNERYGRNQNYDANSYSSNNTGGGSYESFLESDYGSEAAFGSGSGFAGGRYGNTDTEYLPNTNTQWRRPAPREDVYTRGNNDFNSSEREDNYGSFSNNGNTWGSGSNYGSTYGTGSDYGSQRFGQNWNDRSDRLNSHRGKGPKNYQRADSRIQEEINDALTHDHHIDASEIEVSVKEGIVTLTGKVSERKMKRFAEECAEQIRGVKDVRNEITAPSLFSGLLGDKTKTETGKTDTKKLM